ncbi:MAG: hypothetical protein QOD65_720, partial [Gaiellales bacterium]|nr:hypothetical protein [Gaiellales bacterium]
MIRLILVADSGGPMAALTESLAAIASVEIVRHASSRAQLGPIVRRLAPDVVIIDEIHRPRLVLSHVEALTAQAPQVGIVVLTTRPDAG